MESLNNLKNVKLINSEKEFAQATIPESNIETLTQKYLLALTFFVFGMAMIEGRLPNRVEPETVVNCMNEIFCML